MLIAPAAMRRISSKMTKQRRPRFRAKLQQPHLIVSSRENSRGRLLHQVRRAFTITSLRRTQRRSTAASRAMSQRPNCPVPKDRSTEDGSDRICSLSLPSRIHCFLASPSRIPPSHACISSSTAINPSSNSIARITKIAVVSFRRSPCRPHHFPIAAVSVQTII